MIGYYLIYERFDAYGLLMALKWKAMQLGVRYLHDRVVRMDYSRGISNGEAVKTVSDIYLAKSTYVSVNFSIILRFGGTESVNRSAHCVSARHDDRELCGDFSAQSTRHSCR